MANILVIALNTFREGIRSKLLHSVIFFALVLIVAAAFFGTVSIGDKFKIIKDFGLFCSSLFTVILVVVTGSSLLHKELNRKTVYNVLGKAVWRWQFLAGKHLGLLATATVLILLLTLALALFVAALGGGFDRLILVASLYLFFEILIVVSVTIFFSSVVVTPLLIGLFTLAVFITGRSIQYVQLLRDELHGNKVGEVVLDAINYALPHLDQLWIGDRVVYGVGVSSAGILSSFAYALGYSLIVFVLASLIFSRREFN